VIAGACGSRSRPSASIAIVGESTKLRRGDSLPATSAIFDGKTIHLRGACGETLGVQALFTGDAPREVSLAIEGDHVTVAAFRTHWLDVTEPSTDMYGPSSGKGRYPDPLEPVAGGKVTDAINSAYFDVAIARDASPGVQRGTLTIGGTPFPVELTIDPITIDLSTDPLVWVSYDPAKLAAGDGTKDDDGAAELDDEARWEALYRSHGAYLASDLPAQRFLPRRALAAGTRFWPVAFDFFEKDDPNEAVRDMIRAFDGVGPTPFTIIVDEPRPSQRERAATLAHYVSAVAQGKLLTAITDEDRPEYAGVIDVLISPRLATHGPRRWTYNGRPPLAGSMILDTDGVALRTWGWIAWRYDVPLWYAWDGAYWRDSNNRRDATDVLTDPVTFLGGGERGNGDGVLGYPHQWPSLRLEALRRGLEDRLLLMKLAACDRAAADAIARRIIPHALADVAHDAAATWPHDEAAFERARIDLLDGIVRSCPDK
jgi:hypothetical protein